MEHQQHHEPDVAVVHENGARALAGQEMAGEGVARRYGGAARRSASGVDRQPREGDEVARDEDAQRTGGVGGDERDVRVLLVGDAEVRSRAALEGAVVDGATVGAACGERAQARHAPRGRRLGHLHGDAVAGVAVRCRWWRGRVRAEERVVDGVGELEKAEQLDWLRDDGAAVAKPELLAGAERRHAHLGEGGSLAERAEQMVPLVEVHEHGSTRYRPAVALLPAHVVKEVDRAVVAEGLDDVLRGLAAEHDVRADEERRARADDLEIGRDDDAVVEKRRRCPARTRAREAARARA